MARGGSQVIMQKLINVDAATSKNSNMVAAAAAAAAVARDAGGLFLGAVAELVNPDA